MANLINDERNICVELCLKSDPNLDINCLRSEYENWIPFTLRVNVGDTTRFSYCENETLSVEELNVFLHNLHNLCNGQVEKCFFYPVELYFNLALELQEEGLIEIEIWFNKGVLTNGKEYGYSEGLKFFVEKAELLRFSNKLKMEFDTIL